MSAKTIYAERGTMNKMNQKKQMRTKKNVVGTNVLKINFKCIEDSFYILS